ncbi:hypothetical protein F5Y13DRAFT_158374 [Hypoxylon sp. FL1857]|nr:hypothetical protein F5Y13DRAFT_158374 [Hypoxylon sp. FL1857]
MWACPHCVHRGKSEAWFRHLTSHVRYCGYPGCPSTTPFESSRMVAQHIMDEHGGGDWTTGCPWPDCGKKFTQKEEYCRHVRRECIIHA